MAFRYNRHRGGHALRAKRLLKMDFRYNRYRGDTRPVTETNLLRKLQHTLDGAQGRRGYLRVYRYLRLPREQCFVDTLQCP